VTGINTPQPFLLASQSILVLIESGELDPDAPGTGVSYGERQLRTVGSSSRLSFASGMTLASMRKGKSLRSRSESVNIRDVVGRGGKCC
jgi:Ras-related protein Rab-4B